MSPAPDSAQRRSAARTAVVWDALQGVLAGTRAGAAAASRAGDDAAGSRAGDDAVSVVDIGGGTGGFAVRVAELGHRVTVVDPSPDALAILARRAEESGVAGLVTGLQGDLAGLSGLVGAGSADVVLCHGVLEIVGDPVVALGAIAEVLRPGGTLSLLVNQRHAAVLARAMAGHFGRARALLDDPTGGGSTSGGPSGTGGGPRRFTADEVTAVLDEAGFDTTAMYAVRVFVDLVPSSLVDLEPGAATALVELEHAVANRPEYFALATQLHVLATRRS